MANHGRRRSCAGCHHYGLAAAMEHVRLDSRRSILLCATCWHELGDQAHRRRVPRRQVIAERFCQLPGPS